MVTVASLTKVWNEWEVRALVLLSLTLQIILIIMGNRRKYINSIWITIIVWFPYLIADAVATTALGFLTRNTSAADGGLDANVELHAFWAPFLLLHLGGPDTITAYSLEDNELWTRHLLQLVVQTGFSFYIVVLAWTGSLLSILSIPLLFAGLLKYGERTWVLWSASYEQRRILAYSNKIVPSDIEFSVNDEDDISLLAAAREFGTLTNCFFLDMVMQQDQLIEMSHLDEFWADRSHIGVFKIIEMALGFMYDELYTKAMVTYTFWGIVLRFVSFLLSCIVLILFSVLYHEQKHCCKADLCITFLLLTVAVFLELYAALAVLSSNQSIAWLKTHKRSNISRAITSSLQLLRIPAWSGRMGQFSMLSYFFQEKSMSFLRVLLGYLPCQKISYIATVEESLKRKEYEAYQEVPEHLKAFIYRYLFEETTRTVDESESIINSRGKISLRRNGYDYFSGILAETTKADVDLSVIVWHVVTEFSYNLDYDFIKAINGSGNAEIGQSSVWNNIGLCHEISMYISKYMMHLLVFSPHLFPRGGVPSETPLRFTFAAGRAQALSLPKRKGANNAHDTEWKTKIQRLLHELAGPPRSTDPYRHSKWLETACGVLHHFNEKKEVERKWRTICGVWMELLAHISTQCTGNQHAQLLRQGGELLTHVFLLFSYSGMSKHFSPFY